MNIGETAGRVWQYLHANGQVDVTKLAKGTKLKSVEVDRAIGWLAREGKLIIEEKAGRELIKLA